MLGMSLRTVQSIKPTEPQYSSESCVEDYHEKTFEIARVPVPTNGPYVDYSDEELVSLIRGGDTKAFGELVDRHFATCFGRAFLMLRNHSDAEDEVQNAFSKAFESLSQFRFQGPFCAWLCRIVQNQCLMLIRERRRAAFISVDGGNGNESNVRLDLPSQLANQEQQLGAKQVDHLVHSEILRIPPILRDVMLLYDVQGLPMPDVAARLGISVSATKSRLMRGRKELRSRLTECRGRRKSRTLHLNGTHPKSEHGVSELNLREIMSGNPHIVRHITSRCRY
jgi:RNA polymerase sigma-70 factor (ECF subfamily)